MLQISTKGRAALPRSAARSPWLLLKKSVKRKIRYHVESLPAADNGFPGHDNNPVRYFLYKTLISELLGPFWPENRDPGLLKHAMGPNIIKFGLTGAIFGLGPPWVAIFWAVFPLFRYPGSFKTLFWPARSIENWKLILSVLFTYFYLYLNALSWKNKV